VKTARPSSNVKFDYVVCATVSKGRPTAKCAGADDRNLAIGPVPEPGVEKLWTVLVAVEAETEPAIDEVLD
jgi:hypothetical protein